MARINLLPWREELRKKKQKDFYTVMGVAFALMALVVGGVHLYVNSMIEYQKSRNEYLKGEIKIVEGMIKEIEELEKQKQQLIARMDIIEQLQRHRPEAVHMFDELVRITPEGLFITQLKQTNRAIEVIGKAQSNARVSALMRALESSDWFSEPSLGVIQSKGGGAVVKDSTREFKLRVSQEVPKAEAPPMKDATKTAAKVK